ncbi:hypothetical protein SCLCIDRAFT_23700 [Scleroderma citrinum Foug A]|uniref:Uncharacterized protein n=1 Tax=Scleroderma citrinum Foug A TaxID=1036808 RepID=A0A0C3E7T9_9AGAM|nr:hypothetical protein SCLCIDRAFT_23700 [Scleroderma citrinum Foug A]
MAIQPHSSSPTFAAYMLLPFLTVYMATTEGTNIVTASSVEDDTSSPTSCTAEEVIAKSAEIIQGQIDGLRETQDKVIWTEAVVTIWAQVHRIENVLQDLPAGFIIPTIVVATDQFMQAPEVILFTGKWLHIPDIVNATDHNIRNHCWFQLEKSEKKVNKGKGKAIELL